MTKKLWGTLGLVLVCVLLLPASAAAAVPAGVTKGLDYLHDRQRSDGGFSYSSTTGSASDTPWAMLSIAAAANNPSLWRIDGRSPVSFLQDTNLTAAATDSGNPPEYYALCILAYRAANRSDLLANAGSGQIDLVSKLESYQSASGYYSPATGPTADTETTAWALLGLVAAKQSGPAVSAALTWLQATAASDGDGGGPNADGGFGSQPTYQSNTTVTSLVTQALRASGVSPKSALMRKAASFIESMQRSDGGFQDTSDGYANAPSTAWAIEGLRAAGIDPQDLAKGNHTPYTFLASLRQSDGSCYEFPGDIGDVMTATMQSSIALANKTLPIAGSPNVCTRCAPTFASGSVEPENGARFASSTVLVKAGYRDNSNGTGIATARIRITVDGRAKTKAATIHATHLELWLGKLTDGSHTVAITIYDQAGNAAHIQRQFTVAVPVARSTPTGVDTPTSSTSPTMPNSGVTTPRATPSSTAPAKVVPSPTPLATLTPAATGIPTATISPTPELTAGVSMTPTPSESFAPPMTSPSPSPSITGRLVGSGGSSGGDGNTPLAVGTALALLVPLGFAGSWLVRRRLMGVMGGAARGELLLPESTMWGRLWKAGGSPPAGGDA